MFYNTRAWIGHESERPASRWIFARFEPRHDSRALISRKRRFFAPFVRVQKGLAAWHQAKGRCRLIGRHTCTASMRRSHVQHNTARVPRRTPFWPKPQKGAKALFPVHPAASINEPPAPHRERQVAAKGGMLQTRSRPQSCGFRPPVLATTASWSTMFRRRPAYLQ